MSIYLDPYGFIIGRLASASTTTRLIDDSDSTRRLAAVALLAAMAVSWGMRAHGQTAFDSSSQVVVVEVPSSDGVEARASVHRMGRHLSVDR